MSRLPEDSGTLAVATAHGYWRGAVRPRRPRSAGPRGDTRHLTGAPCPPSSLASRDINIVLLTAQIKHRPQTPALDYPFELKVTFCVRGVISPLLSNIYLNEVDTMLERAQAVTREEEWTRVEYARFADDLVVLVDAHPRHAWLRSAVERRLREEFAKLQVAVNEDKSRRVDLTQGERFGFLGFEFRRIRSRRGRWMPRRTPQLKKRTAMLRTLKQVFRRSVSARRRRDCLYQSDAARLGAILCGRPFQPVFLVHSRLGREEDSGPLGAYVPTSRVRLEAVEPRVAVWDPGPVLGLPGCLFTS